MFLVMTVTNLEHGLLDTCHYRGQALPSLQQVSTYTFTVLSTCNLLHLAGNLLGKTTCLHATLVFPTLLHMQDQSICTCP